MSCSTRLGNVCYSYTDKVNIYKSDVYIPVPTIISPLPPSMPLYYALGVCNQPYQVPTYYPPGPYCKGPILPCTCGSVCDKCRR